MLRSRIETLHTLNDASRLYGTENGNTRKILENDQENDGRRGGASAVSFVLLPFKNS